jgi:hypothetical protein
MAGNQRALEISVACASRIAARVECVIEALRAQGHAATLHTGSSAREALVAADRRSWRVLLLAERLDAEQLRKLEEGLDPERLGNLLVTTIDRSAPEMAERIEAFARVAKQARQRRTPAVIRIAEPTPLPANLAPLGGPRRWAVPVGIAAIVGCGLVVALQYGLRPESRAEEAHAPAVAGTHAAPSGPDEQAPRESSNEAIERSIEVPLSDEEIEIFDIHRARSKRAKKSAQDTAPASPENVAAPSRRIADAPALHSGKPLGLDLTPRHRELPTPGEEQSLK